MHIEDAVVINATQSWLERAVVGLRLCPFAEPPLRASRIRFRVSAASTESELLEHLREELSWLSALDPSECETSLLIHPQVLSDFLLYNDFLEACDATLQEMDLEGVLQIASFHPQYQFADSGADDIENYTNRSPYPMLHLLREDSIDKALRDIADPDEIYLKNMRTMRRLGVEGWRKLWTA